jgi:hypothetical protein
MPLLPPLLPSTPAPPLFCRLRFSPPSAVLLLLPPIHQLNPLHRDTGMIFIASSAACAASAGNFAAAAAAADAAAAAADAADTVISAAACTDTAPASVTAACCANNLPYAATIAAKNTRLSRSQFPVT